MENKKLTPTQKMRNKRTAAGLCINCGQNPHEPDRKLCADCAEWRRKYDRSVYAERIRLGICVYCGKAPALPDMTACEACRLKKKEKNRIWREKNK